MIHIVLYRPEKPLNTGNIMRTCSASNSELHIIGPLSFSLDEKDIKRAGLDYITSLNYHFYDNYDEFIKENPHINLYYVTRYSNKVYSELDYSNKDIDYWFMFGRESTGIPHDILRANKDRLIRIPMKMDARSLNLSNCVAIVLYEALRQQEFNDLSTHEAIKGEDFLERENSEK